MTANQSRDCEGAVPEAHGASTTSVTIAPSSRLGWHLTLFSAGLLYTVADLVFNLEIPVLGLTIVLLLAREILRRDAGNVT